MSKVAVVAQKSVQLYAIGAAQGGQAVRVIVKALRRVISWWINRHRQAAVEKSKVPKPSSEAREPRESLSPERLGPEPASRIGDAAEITTVLEDSLPIPVAPDDGHVVRLDRSSLENIVHIEEAGGALIVDTAHGERLRVSASRDARSGRFLSAYETMGAFIWKRREILVWQPTSSYRAVTVPTLEECLESALAEVEAGPRPPEPEKAAEPEIVPEQEQVEPEDNPKDRPRGLSLRRRAKHSRTLTR